MPEAIHVSCSNNKDLFKVLNNQKTLGYDFSLRKGINFIKKKTG